jgi:hypothetical protein
MIQGGGQFGKTVAPINYRLGPVLSRLEASAHARAQVALKLSRARSSSWAIAAAMSYQRHYVADRQCGNSVSSTLRKALATIR